jgi:hypothetical protein
VVGLEHRVAVAFGLPLGGAQHSLQRRIADRRAIATTRHSRERRMHALLKSAGIPALFARDPRDLPIPIGKHGDEKVPRHHEALAKIAELTSRTEKAEAEATEREVGALVGVKITAAEQPAMLSLLRQSPDLFRQLVDARPDLQLTREVTKTEAADKSAATTGTGALDAYVERKRQEALEHAQKEQG